MEHVQCLQAAQHLPAKPEEAEALCAAVRSIRGMLQQYACQASGLGLARATPEPVPDLAV